MADQETLMLDSEEEEQENKYLLFLLGNEEYGINITMVQSIEELPKITALPDMPEYITGVTNLRGKVTPVMDLRRRLRMPDREYDDRTCLVVAKVGMLDIGFIVDTVSEVEEIPESDRGSAPDFRSEGNRRKYVTEMGKSGEKVRLLLDVNRLISEEELEGIMQIQESDETRNQGGER
jgi:purine-binding chemotaxis protein CheW